MCSFVPPLLPPSLPASFYFDKLWDLFDDIDISEQDKADILGGNAARLFRLHRPEFRAAA